MFRNKISLISLELISVLKITLRAVALESARAAGDLERILFLFFSGRKNLFWNLSVQLSGLGFTVGNRPVKPFSFIDSRMDTQNSPKLLLWRSVVKTKRIKSVSHWHFN